MLSILLLLLLQEPYNLPNGFVWSECSVEDPQVLDEVGATPGVRIFSRLAKDSDVALLSVRHLVSKLRREA